MARGKTRTRRPVKARGSIPAPKVAPARTRIPWYRRRAILIVGGVLVAGLIALIVLNILGRRSERRELEEQIARFERRYSTLQLSGANVGQEMNTSPGEFQAGQLSPEAFAEQIEGWLEHLRRVDESIRSATVPNELTEARAQLINGNLLLIDATKGFQQAITATDPVVRDQLINSARTLLTHAASVLQLGQRELLKTKQRLGFASTEEETALQTPPQLPSEEVAPQPPPQPTAPPVEPSPPPSPEPSPAGAESPSPQPSPTA